MAASRSTATASGFSRRAPRARHSKTIYRTMEVDEAKRCHLEIILAACTLRICESIVESKSGDYGPKD